MILFNATRVVPNVAKYLPPMWPWVAPVWGSIGLQHRRCVKRTGKPSSVKTNGERE